MLRIIKVGHDDASERYVRNKIRAVRNAGMETELIQLEDANTASLVRLLEETAGNENISAVIVQLPLPKHINKERVLAAIAPRQDIDGLNPKSGYKPLTPCAIMRWLREQRVDVSGKQVCIIGRSDLVGKPLANMMIEAGATVIVCNSKTPEFVQDNYIRHSDIVVSAAGVANLISLDNIGCRNQVVIDVGINRDANGKLCGDVSDVCRDFAEDWNIMITPVPNGVGKWTVAELVMRLKQMEGKM